MSSDKLAPALWARSAGRYPSMPPPQSSWYEYFASLSNIKLPTVAWPAWYVTMRPEKKQLFVAVSITAAVSMGGFFIWYLYALKQRPGPGKIVESKEKKFGIDQINKKPSRSAIARRNNEKALTLLDANKNISQSVLILHQCPRGRRTPCIAPYPLKLETFLRIHDIKYEVDFNNVEPRHSDAPWITLDLEDVCDSQNCMKFLVERYSLDVDGGFTDTEKSTVRAYTHLLENHLYWGIALWRWVYDGARSLNEIQSLPAKTLQMIPQVCKTVEQAAWFHGIGKKTPHEVAEAVLQDLAALSNLLGKKAFFFGDKPCELDCTAFAMLAQMLWNMDGSPFEGAIKDKHTNLVEFCWRMRTTFWPDWESCLNNAVAEVL